MNCGLNFANFKFNSSLSLLNTLNNIGMTGVYISGNKFGMNDSRCAWTFFFTILLAMQVNRKECLKLGLLLYIIACIV